jgi:hypothetical protein
MKKAEKLENNFRLPSNELLKKNYFFIILKKNGFLIGQI